MKAESTIRKMENRLLAIAHHLHEPERVRNAAYDMACALQWVRCRTDWTPVDVAGEWGGLDAGAETKP